MDEEYYYNGIAEMQEDAKSLARELMEMETAMRQGYDGRYLRHKLEASNLLNKMKTGMLFVPSDDSDFWGSDEDGS
jgi:hypothetical protein